MRDLFPDFESDPNDCYFEDVSIENQKNKANEKKFFHIVDMRLNLNINNDNRFSYFVPTVTNITPHMGTANGGMKVHISGMNFGVRTSQIKEVLVMNIPCKSFKLVNSTLISCVLGESVAGVGSGNVIVKMVAGITSPIRTCKMFEYTPKRLILPMPVITVVKKKTPLIIQPAKVKKVNFPKALGERRPKKLLGEPEC